MQFTRKIYSAFTLIELLVVVAIITVLIAILIPTLGRARNQAKLTLCQTHLRAWGLGFHVYSAQNDDALPLDGGDGTTAKPIGKWNDPYLWFNGCAEMANNLAYNDLYLASSNSGNTGGPLPTLGANSLYVCPLAVSVAPGSGDVVANGYFRVVGWSVAGTGAAGTQETRDMLLCYAYNSQIRNPNWDWTGAQYPPRSDFASGDITKLRLLAPDVVLVVEKRINNNEIRPQDDPRYSNDNNTNLAQAKVAPTRFTGRHNFGGSLTFADGHVEYFPAAKVCVNMTATPKYNQPGQMTWIPQP